MRILIENYKRIGFYCFFIVLCLGIFLYKKTIPQHLPEYYYNIIGNQEKIEEDVKITEQDKKEIFYCKENYQGGATENCLRDVYYNITLKIGPEKAFAHLALLEREYPNMLAGCHYISHGIGHATLKLNNNDIFKTFSIMNDSSYFKNIATCGNGYFHGVIEEYSKNITDKNKLVDILKPICDKERGDCYHGVGHAAFIQLGQNIGDSIFVCSKISDKKPEVFGCYTGAFMQLAQDSKTAVSVKNGFMSFDVCDRFEGMVKTACYLEHSSEYEIFTKDRKNYTRNIGFCKQIDNDVNRMACVKLFAIRAVRIVRFTEIEEMCKNTSNKYEKIICTAIVADRIGGSADKTRKTQVYKEAVQDVCKTLNIFEQVQCVNIVYHERVRLFYTAETDLQLPKITWQMIKETYLK